MLVGRALRRQRGIVTLGNSWNSEIHVFHFESNSAGRTSSQSRPAAQIYCINNFARIVNGDKNWSGSKRDAMQLKTLLFVDIELVGG